VLGPVLHRGTLAGMRTTQSVIARMEAGRYMPHLTTLEKLAEMTVHRLEVRLVPEHS